MKKSAIGQIQAVVSFVIDRPAVAASTSDVRQSLVSVLVISEVVIARSFFSEHHRPYKM